MQDNLHDAQTTNEKGIINLAKERMDTPLSAPTPSFVRPHRKRKRRESNDFQVRYTIFLVKLDF